MIDGLPFESVLTFAFNLADAEREEARRYASEHGYKLEEAHVVFGEEMSRALWCTWNEAPERPKGFPAPPDLFQEENATGVGPDREARFLLDRVAGWEENEALTARHWIANYARNGPSPTMTAENYMRRLSEYGSAFLENKTKARAAAEDAYQHAAGELGNGTTGLLREGALPALHVRVTELRRLVDKSAREITAHNNGLLADWLCVAFALAQAGDVEAREHFDRVMARIHLGTPAKIALSSAWLFFDAINTPGFLATAQLMGLSVLLHRREPAMLFAIRARDKLNIYERLLRNAVLDRVPSSGEALQELRQDAGAASEPRTTQELAITLSDPKSRVRYIQDVLYPRYNSDGPSKVAEVARQKWVDAGLAVDAMPGYFKSGDLMRRNMSKKRTR